MTSAHEAEQAINQLFAVAGVKRVISVDDSYANKFPVEDALGYAEQLDPAVLDAIFTDYPEVVGVGDVDVRRRKIKEIWGQMERSIRRKLTELLRSASKDGGLSPAGSNEGRIDETTVELLPELFQRYELVSLSLEEWHGRKNELVTVGMPPTLIMVDEDFSHEGGGPEEGIRLIKELLGAGTPEKVLCALLSHKYSPARIHEDWTELCHKEKLDKSSFVLIPKSLLGGDMVDFARLVKLAILNGSSDKLKKKSAEILRAAEEETRKRLDAIDIYDFDQIVFRSSYREGVWEPDTLFRVFGLFHREETRKLAKEDKDIRDIATEIRAISQIPTESETAPSRNTMAVERLELYENAEYLTSHYMPLDIGDIFQKTGESAKRFILLAQPCDLMVRSDGRRSAFSKEALLAEIVTGPVKDFSSHGELKFLDPNDSTEYFVSFKKSYIVRLLVLDLCALNANGEAVFLVGATCPERVIPAWKVHYDYVSKEVQKVLTRIGELNQKGLDLRTAVTLAARCSSEGLFTAKVDLGAKRLSYNVKRVGRLRQLRAAALLTRYANFIARQAFDPDFGERVQDNVPSKDAGHVVATMEAVESLPTEEVPKPSTEAAGAAEADDSNPMDRC